MTYELPKTILERFLSKKFVILGRAGLDLYPNPIGLSTQDADNFISDLGGSAANIAVSMSKLGCNTFLCSTFSDDSVGDFIKKKLEIYNINTDYCNSISGSYKNSLALAENKTHKPKVVIYRNNAADLQISKELIKTINFEFKSGLIITGTALSSEPSRGSVFAAVKLAKKNKCPVILDFDYRKDAWSSSMEASEKIGQIAIESDFCIGNEEEFDVLGLKNNFLSKDFAFYLAKKGKIIIYKKGDLGCEFMYLNNHFSLGAFNVKSLKPFGAGDAFMGGFISSLSRKNNLKDSLIFGSACAALVVSKIGCSSAMPVFSEVKTFIHNNKYKG